MKQAAPVANPVQKAAEHSISRPAEQVAVPGQLGQLAAMVNDSSRVQEVAQLKYAVQQSPRMQSLMGLTAAIAGLAGING